MLAHCCVGYCFAPSLQYLVLACDGIWDVMTNEDVAAFILGKAKSGVDDCGQLAAELLDACLEKGSRDNMSAVVVEFKGAPRPTKCV
jgi:serine/threonine protein phosphatase PrpC